MQFKPLFSHSNKSHTEKPTLLADPAVRQLQLIRRRNELGNLGRTEFQQGVQNKFKPRRSKPSASTGQTGQASKKGRICFAFSKVAAEAAPGYFYAAYLRHICDDRMPLDRRESCQGVGEH